MHGLNLPFSAQLVNFENKMWRTELQEVKEEFQLVQFRLLYSNAGDFAETPVSVAHEFAILFAYLHA